MSIRTIVEDGGDRVTISVTGRFDFKSHQDFRSAYETGAGKGVHYEVDMAGADYLDSSALGMLLMLREYAGGDGADVSITNPSPNVKNILDISNFEKLFRIE